MYDNVALILAVKSQECLWNCRSVGYMCRGIRREAWRQIGKQLINGIDELSPGVRDRKMKALKRKWDCIKRYHKNETRRQDLYYSTRTHQYVPRRRYIFKDLLGFLDTSTTVNIKPPSDQVRIRLSRCDLINQMIGITSKTKTNGEPADNITISSDSAKNNILAPKENRTEFPEPRYREEKSTKSKEQTTNLEKKRRVPKKKIIEPKRKTRGPKNKTAHTKGKATESGEKTNERKTKISKSKETRQTTINGANDLTTEIQQPCLETAECNQPQLGAHFTQTAAPMLETSKTTQQKPPEPGYLGNNPNVAFLFSCSHEMDEMTSHQQMEFKLRVMSLLNVIKYPVKMGKS